MRRFNIKEKVQIKLDLYKNRYEIIAEIPLDCVENIKYKFNDIDEISLTIPKYISNNGKSKINHLYNKINSRHIIVVTTTNADGTEKQQKFTLANKKSIGRKNTGSKSFIAFSWEKTLERQRITVDALARQLTNKDDDVHIGEGILDLICAKTGWKVGYVDPKARTKVSLNVQTFNKPLYTDLSINKVADKSLIFDKNVNIEVAQDKPLYLTMNYSNIKIFDEKNILLSSMNIMNDMTDTPLYTNLTNIKAYHHSEAGNRFGIRYVFTMNDGVTIEKICTFTNCIDKKMTIDTINLSYDFGDVVEEENIQYSNFEAFDDSAYKFLQDIQNVFECIFDYDTMNNIINVYAHENLNVNSGYCLTLGENVIEINTSEDESIPTMLKVDSENTSIIEHNPNGTQFIENYSYYIKNGLISDSLKNALEEYDRISVILMDEWNILNRNKSVLSQKYVKAESEVKSLTERIKNLTNLLSSFFNSDSDRQLEVKQEIEELELRVAELLSLMSTYKTEMDKIDKQIEVVNGETQKENMVNEQGVKVFTEEDLLILNDIREIIMLSDNYYTTGYGLYGYAKRYLEDKANPKVEFSLTCVDLVNLIRNPRGWNNILELGNLFPVEENDMIQEKEIRLTELEVVPIKGKGCVKANSLKFSNKLLDTTVRVGANIGKTTNRIQGKISDFSEVWESSKMSNNFVKSMREQGLNLASANINARSMRNKLDFSEAGMFVIDATNEDNQLYMGASIIAFSNDKFKTCKTALDQNGLIAKTLIGEIILGNKLVIQSDDGLFYVGNDEGTKNFGMSVYDSLNEGRQKRIFLGLEETPTGRKAILRLIGKDGQVALSEEGIISEFNTNDRTNVDSNAPMYSYVRLQDNINTVKDAILTIKMLPFRIYSKGMESAGYTKSTYTSLAGGGGTSGYAGYGQTTYTSTANDSFPYDMVTSEEVSNPGGKHVHYYDASVLPHKHSFVVTYPEHSHGISAHSHKTEITIDAHSHNQLLGCFDDTVKPSNVSITVNGTLVRSNINGDSVEVNIAQYLQKNKLNEIVIKSATRGCIQTNLYVKSFVYF